MADEAAADGAGAPSIHVGDVDGEATPIGGRSGREARLDLLLAEELANDVALLRDLVTRIDTSRVDLPDGKPTRATVRINVDEFGPDLDARCHGETDIEVLASWPDRVFPILIEDKVWAPFQHLQPERYVGRAEARRGAAVLAAPSAFLEAHEKDAEKFHARLPIEDVIQWLRREAQPSEAKRRRWRAALLCELIEPQRRGAAADDKPTVEFTTFCVGWFTKAQVPVEPATRSLHSAGQGWLWFKSPRGLGYKASGWARTDRAAVDLYLADHGFTGDLATLERLLETISPPEDFFATTDTAKNVILRCWCGKVSPSEGKPEEGSTREASVFEALEACRRAAEWLLENEARLLP